MRLHFNFSVVLPLFARVGRQLVADHGVEGFSGCVYGRDSLAELDEIGFPRDGVVALTDALREFGDRDPDLEFLKSRETLYGDPNLYIMIAGCRFVSEFGHRRALQVLEVCLRVVEDLYDRYRPDAVISDGVACTLSYAQYAVARARGIPFLVVAPARVNGRFYVIHNHRDRYERVEALYEGFKANGLPPASRQRAEQFVAKFRASAVKPDYFVQLATVPGFDWASLGTLRELARRRRQDPDNYLLASPWSALWGRVVRVAKARLLDRRHFQRPVPGEKYVFFPLHFQPELTTLILAPFYVNQIATIENVAKTLPIDHVLYVKEHKASLGRRAPGYYEAIRRIPNVRLLSPFLDSHDIIKACSAVCVISSTVGWEAILYEKPVVSLGDVFYNAFSLVQRVQSMTDVASALSKAIDVFVPDYDETLAFVAANLEGIYEGDVFHPPGVETSPSLTPANVARVADIIASEVRMAATPATVGKAART